MLVMILLFFFTNVYVWHDTAVKQANQLYVKQLSYSFKIQQDTTGINITADGGSDIYLSRLWIIDSTNPTHLYANLTNQQSVYIKAGNTINIIFDGSTVMADTTGVMADMQGDNVRVHYQLQSDVTYTLNVINTFGMIKTISIEL
jgi:hypothetical protein